VADVNKLLKMHRQMADMMKMMGKKKGMLGKMMGGLGMGGMPDVDPKQLEEMAKSGQLPGGMDLPKGLPGRTWWPGLGGRVCLAACRVFPASVARKCRAVGGLPGMGKGKKEMSVSDAENRLGESRPWPS
jgi:signal recognition particle subunit SRP54